MKFTNILIFIAITLILVFYQNCSGDFKIDENSDFGKEVFNSDGGPLPPVVDDNDDDEDDDEEMQPVVDATITFQDVYAIMTANGMYCLPHKRTRHGS